MDLEYIKKLVEGMKAEVVELDKEHDTTLRQLQSKKISLQSQIAAFEEQINRIRIGG